MAAIPVNPEVLRWARLTRDMSLEQAADRIGISVAELQEIESANTITGRLLNKIAKKYKFQPAALMMPEPLPLIVNRPPDFRVHVGEVPSIGFDAQIVLEEINEILESFLEFQEHDAELLGPIDLETVSLDDGPNEVAARQRELLGVTIDRQLDWDGETDAYRTWRELVERQGVFVYQYTLKNNTIRGISIWDDRSIPVIIINTDADTYQPRIFTLLHEYGHILLRQGGISDENRSDRVERWCNQFAAAVLMPSQAFMREAGFTLGSPPREWGDNEIRRLAKRFKVSQHAVLIHLEELQMALAGFVQQRVQEWAAAGPPRSGGFAIAKYPVRIVNHWGGRHVDVVMNALDRGAINNLDAHELLNLSPKWFEELKETVRLRHARYGG